MKYIDGQTLKQLFISGANNLYNHYPKIDQLNVFPVPDGDTGMNMNLTLSSGAKEIQNKNDNSIGKISKSFSKGLLMGARGNSGVITSQIFRGFSDGLEGKDKVNAKQFAEAWVNGKEVAYKAVMRPVEGTILTVIREASDALLMATNKKKDMSIEEAITTLFKEAKRSLNRTPDLLPILKEVGVVDSGGAGLCTIFEGMVKASDGEFVKRKAPKIDSPIERDEEDTLISEFFRAPGSYAGAEISNDHDDEFGYCTQFILRLGSGPDGMKKQEFNETTFSNYLKKNGNSIVLVRDDDIVKVHVHTLTPGLMLNYAQRYGEFVTIVIENMGEEHDNIANGTTATDMESNLARNKEAKDSIKDKPYADSAVIACSSGDGLDEIFKELGATYIVKGGQTMNPSTQDFAEAIEQCHAHKIYILPNNGNIILAASQACELVDDKQVEARVIPAKTIMQGISALMNFVPEVSMDECFESMAEGVENIKSGSVTFATKDTDIDGVHITKDYYIAMGDGHDIVTCVKDKNIALQKLLDNLITDDDSLVTVFFGSDIKPEQAEAILAELTKKYPDVDIDVRNGGQPIYSFLVGVE